LEQSAYLMGVLLSRGFRSENLGGAAGEKVQRRQHGHSGNRAARNSGPTEKGAAFIVSPP
jgi:hypothetical protein